MKHLLRFSFVLAFLISTAFSAQAYEAGDTVTVNTTRYVIKGTNLIPNPGFEDGFTNWTDASTSAATLSSDNFKIEATGGVDDSKFLVGTVNGSSSATSSIGTGWSIASGKTYVLSYYVKYLTTTTAANAEYLKISLTNNKTASTEPKVLINASQIAANNQWTLNTVAFTNSSPTYSYVVARFRWLNNQYGFDNFSLFEAYEVTDVEGLQTIIDEAKALYSVSGNAAADFLQAITTAESFLSSESFEDVNKAKADLTQAIFDYKLLNATSEKPLDMTSYITNPGFDENTGTGWSNTGTINYHSAEFYEKTFDMYQTVKGLPAGKYTLQMRGFERPKGNDSGAAYRAGTEKIYACFYANSSSFPERTVPFTSIYKHKYSGSGNSNGYVNTMGGAEIMFNNADSAYYVTSISNIILDKGATLTIGARSEFKQTGYWVLFDDFRLFYEGTDNAAAAAQVSELIAAAQELVPNKMHAAVATELSAAIEQGQQAVTADPLVVTALSSISFRLADVISAAKASSTAFTALQAAIDAAAVVYEGGGNAASVQQLQEDIETAKTAENNLDTTLEGTNNATAALNTAVFSFRLANGTGTAPKVVTNTQYARGSTTAFLRGTFTGTSTERGICWSTDPNPSILDNRSSKTFGTGTTLFRIDDLQPSTVYYMRAYAITSTYAVGYGDVIKVITIPKGTTTYNMVSGFPDADRTRVDAAMKSAVEYYNSYTSIKGLGLTVNYGSGTPTAEASYGGWMRFGPSSSYQQTGTALHEMGHTIGVGQHWYWTNTTGSPLKVSGKWQGYRANDLLNFMDGSSGAQMAGDGTHSWPYGINGAHEDLGTEWLYTMNALITQGLGEDGLPTPTGKFTTPAYTFEHTDGVKYYIKNEDVSAGRDTSFVIEGSNSTLVYRKMSSYEASVNDSAAWYLTFDPVKCYYTIQNAATGKLFNYANTGSNGIKLINRESPVTANYFQLMGGRTSASVGVDGKKLSKRGYYIIYPTAAEKPYCLVASSNKTTSAGQFDITNAGTLQRWVILSGEELEKIDSSITDDGSAYIKVLTVEAFNNNGILYLENLPENSEITIYSIGGMVSTVSNISDSYSLTLPQGAYIVKVCAAGIEERIKVIIQ